MPNFSPLDSKLREKFERDRHTRTEDFFSLLARGDNILEKNYYSLSARIKS